MAGPAGALAITSTGPGRTSYVSYQEKKKKKKSSVLRRLPDMAQAPGEKEEFLRTACVSQKLTATVLFTDLVFTTLEKMNLT
jgi:hypothetical protein